MQKSSYKAIGCTRFGTPDVFETLTLPFPTLNPSDLLVEVKAMSVNPLDFKIRQGRRNPTTIDKDHPRVPGYDTAGVVVEVGSEVKKFKIGDEVYFSSNFTRYGSYARYIVIDNSVVGFKPKKSSFGEAAAMPLATLTAWECLSEHMGIPEDKEKNKEKTLLVIAGAGGVGSTGIQIAKKVHGLTVIASASRPETIDYVKKCGADYVINHKNSISSELEKIGMKEVDYVLHCWEFDNYYAKELCGVIKPFGVLCIMTFLEDISPMHFQKPIVFVHGRKGFRAGHGERLDKLAQLMDDGEVFSAMTEEAPFTLENIINAHKRLEGGSVIGKLVFNKLDEFDP